MIIGLKMAILTMFMGIAFILIAKVNAVDKEMLRHAVLGCVLFLGVVMTFCGVTAILLMLLYS